MYPVVRHKKTNSMYLFKGDNIFQNIVTNVEGVVSDETAASIFAVNLDATKLINEYPNLKLLIEKLELKIEPPITEH